MSKLGTEELPIETKKKLCVSRRVINTNAANVYIDCICGIDAESFLETDAGCGLFVIEPEGSSGESFNRAIDHDGSHTGVISTQPGEHIGEMIYGKTVAVPPTKAVRLLLSPNLRGAIFMIMHEMNKQEYEYD